MLKKLRQGQKGFTLIELLIVIAIIGIIAALLIPNFLDALQKGKQKRSMGDMKTVGTAMFSWATDQAQASAAGITVNASTWAAYVLTSTALEAVLVPTSGAKYLQFVPPKDGWKNNFVYALNTLNPSTAENVMFIQSIARDGTAQTSWTAGNFEPTDYDQDIVWAEGYFVRFPGKAS